MDWVGYYQSKTLLFFFKKKFKLTHASVKYKSKQTTISMTGTTKLVNLIMRDGKKMKYNNYFMLALKKFYNAFYIFNMQLNFKYPYYAILHNFYRTNLIFLNLNFLYLYLSTYLTPLFFVKVIKSTRETKKVAREFKVKYKTIYVYIKKDLRMRLMLKQLVLYSSTFDSRDFYLRFYFSVLNTSLE